MELGVKVTRRLERSCSSDPGRMKLILHIHMRQKKYYYPYISTNFMLQPPPRPNAAEHQHQRVTERIRVTGCPHL